MIASHRNSTLHFVSVHNETHIDRNKDQLKVELYPNIQTVVHRAVCHVLLIFKACLIDINVCVSKWKAFKCFPNVKKDGVEV
jgi:hypothetical protein